MEFAKANAFPYHPRTSAKSAFIRVLFFFAFLTSLRQTACLTVTVSCHASIAAQQFA